MWHLIIVLPIVGVIVFWLFAPGVAVPIYLIILLVSGMLYWSVARAMRRRPKTGQEGLIGATATVVSRSQPGANAQYTVRTQGELWSANSSDTLKAGELVTIAGIDRLTLLVQRIASSQEADSTT